MKKKVLKTTFLLMMISAGAKLLSFLIRISIARLLNEEAINYYSLSMPVLMFLITLSNFGIPNALTKLVASKKEAYESISASILLSVANNLLLCLVCILGIPLYARIIMKQDVLIPVLYACIPMLPMVMVTGLLKGYFSGKQRMLLASSAQITEEIFRLVFLLVFYPAFSDNPVTLAAFAIFSQTIGEIGSCLHLSLSLIVHHPYRIRPYLTPHFQIDAMQELLSLSVPMTAARMIGSLTAFLEPILMINVAAPMMKEVYVTLYSQLNTYILPLITLPGFFSIAISSWVLPAFSEAYGNRQDKKSRTIFLLSTGFCLFMGIGCALILYGFNKPICELLYHKSEMAALLKMMALPFSLHAAQPVLSCILHGAGKSSRAMLDTTCGCFVRLVSMMILCHQNIPEAAPIAMILSSLVTTMMHLHACSALFINQRKPLCCPQPQKYF